MEIIQKLLARSDLSKRDRANLERWQAKEITPQIELGIARISAKFPDITPELSQAEKPDEAPRPTHQELIDDWREFVGDIVSVNHEILAEIHNQGGGINPPDGLSQIESILWQLWQQEKQPSNTETGAIEAFSEAFDGEIISSKQTKATNNNNNNWEINW